MSASDPLRRPRWVRAAWRWCIPSRHREAIEGDILEVYHSRVLPVRGPRRGRAWLHRELARVAFDHIRERIRERITALAGIDVAGALAVAGADLVRAARGLARSPGYALAAALTLALAIGPSIAVYAVADAVLFRPLPFDEAHRLVGLREHHATLGSTRLAYRTFAELRDTASTVESVALFDSWQPALERAGEPVRLTGARVTGQYFEVLRIHATLGRVIGAADDRPDAAPVVVLAEPLWRTQFAADPAILGSTVRLDGVPHTVVGIVPSTHTWDEAGWDGFWVPFARDDAEMRTNPGRFFRGVARIADGVALTQVEAEVASLYARLVLEHPDTHDESLKAEVRGLQAYTAGPRAPAILWLLLGATALLLVLAAVNVSSVTLARTAARAPELATRRALGASSARLASLVVGEALLVCVVGGALGVILASWAIAVAPAWSSFIPASRIEVDHRVLVAALVATLAAAFVVGLAPVVAARARAAPAASRAGVGGSRAVRRLQRAFLVAQVAAAVVLLVGAGLLGRSVDRLVAVDTGFDTSSVVTVALEVPEARYADHASRARFFRDVIDRVSTLPGVASVGIVRMMPLWTDPNRDGLRIEGAPPVPPALTPIVRDNVVSPGGLEALGVPLVAGRPFDEGEEWTTGGVVLVNETLARRFWPSRDPVGRRLATGSGGPWLTVAGVVRDSVQERLDQPVAPEVYHAYSNPYRRLPWRRMHLVVRTSTATPEAHLPAIAARVAEVDPLVPLSEAITTREVVTRALGGAPAAAAGVATFALLSLLLAAVGLYGLVAEGLANRTQEIGLMLALGAQRSTLLRIAIRDSLRLVIAGVVAGCPVALAGAWLGRATLTGVTVWDLRVFVAAILAIVAIAVAATTAPAWRATRLSPAEALRRR